MRVGVLGINHKSSDLSFREKLAKACQRRLSCNQEIAESLNCVVLSTCNRTEIYFSSEDLPQAHSDLLQVLRDEISESFEHKLYTYFGSDCFVHLALVTAGLDSVIIAESEIQRQVKVAYSNVALYYRLPGCMHYLFQKSLKIGKQIRSRLALPEGQVALPGMIFRIAQITFEDLADKKVLFIGNSEINRKVISFFRMKGCTQLSLSTRSVVSAQEFAQTSRVAVYGWEEIRSWPSYDIVICGTHFSDYLIHRPTAEMTGRKLLFDLGVPRNINPSVGKHPLVTLLNIESLGDLIEEAQDRNSSAIEEAEENVWQTAHRYVELYHAKEQRVPVCV